MTLIRRGKICSNNKDTRWDRIRKRNSLANNSANLKTEVVKRFIEIDYIGKHQKDLLNGVPKPEMQLDPAMVMDLRHEMFKQIPRKLPLATVAYPKNLDVCKSHNIAVEEHYIENQLQQFRQHLLKQSKRNKIPEKKVHSLLIDNGEIMKSLSESQKHIEDFYNTPMEALAEMTHLFENELEKEIKYMANDGIERATLEEIYNSNRNEIKDDKNKKEDISNELTEDQNEMSHLQCKSNVEEVKAKGGECDSLQLFPEMTLFHESNEELQNALRQGTPSPLADTDEILKPLRENIAQNEGLHLRCVRFDEDVSVCQFKRESSSCSNNSDGIESVISELAEEAWLELQMEAEAKLTTIPENDNSLNQDNECNTKENNNLTSHKSAKDHKSKVDTDLIVRGKITEIRRRVPEELPTTPPTSTSTDTDGQEEDLCSNEEQTQIIQQLFEMRPEDRIAVMRKYFLKWLHFTNIEKIEREHVNGHADRVKKINIFLNKIRMEKTRLKNGSQKRNDDDESAHNAAMKKDPMGNIQINKKYQTKIKVQQDIIDLQRVKLERQERIIMELKLHKLSEEAREARIELKNELKSVIRTGDAKSKAKAKCLQHIGNLRDEDDERLDKLQGKALLMPKFLQSMHERALERSIRHEQAKQRRLQQEAEREAQKLAFEDAKRQEDEEAKRMRIEALKEKRRHEKMAKIIKERERQRYMENVRKAQEFYRRMLLRRIGMEAFKRLLQRKKENLRKCEELRRSIYKRNYFQAWFSLYRILKARRYQKAVGLHEHILKRQYMQYWLFYVSQERSKYMVAIDYHEMKLSEDTFNLWFGYTKRMQMIEESKMKQAASHHEWHLKWKVLDCWQRLPQILKLEKETEERRQRWRMKIWELLPDYTPNRDELNFV